MRSAPVSCISILVLERQSNTPMDRTPWATLPIDDVDARQYGIAMTTLTFKVTDREARLIRSRARKERVTVSEYLRRASLSLTPAREPAKVRCPHTGAMIFAVPDHQPPPTTAVVRELLSDFP